MLSDKLFTDNVNSAHTKINPKITLSPEQDRLVNKVMNFINRSCQTSQHAVFTIYGDAGTGKSVILSHLFDLIQHQARQKPDSLLYQTHNYFLVNHPEVLKVYKSIAATRSALLKKDFERPTTFINWLDKQHDHADVVVIDEAHLLLSKPDHYNNFYFENQLEEIIRRSRVVILVFDESQVLRMKSWWTTQRLTNLLSPYLHGSYRLRHQFRMTADDSLIRWFDEFTGNRTVADLTKAMFKHYDFRVYDDAELMRQAIVRRNNEIGLSRVLSTSGYPSTLDGGKHYITEGHFKMPWDQYNYTQTPWAELPQTIDEVGSIYTCQGFDLNYAGIIIGPPVSLIPHTHQLQVNLDRYTDNESFKSRSDLVDPKQVQLAKEKMVMNSLNVLFKRGIRGTYLYAHDEQLRNLLHQLFNKAH